MARPEYPTSIRLTVIDKRRLRKQAEKSKRSLAGLIQMILIQWLEQQEKPPAAVELIAPSPPEVDKPLIGVME